MFEAWCAAIPGVKKTEKGLWKLAQESDISFPATGHEALAAVEETSFWFNHRNAVLAAVLRRLPPGGTLFDIGGGNGYVSAGLMKAGFDSAVIEPGEAGVRMAHERGLPVLQAAFHNLEIPDNSIPAAGLFDVLEHIGDDQTALAELHRTMVPGGRLYIAVPCHPWLWSDEDVQAGHFRRYTANVLIAKVQEAGFVVEYETFFFAALLLPILLLRAVPGWVGLRRNKTISQNHALPGGPVGRLLAWSFERERSAIASGRRRRLGASLLMVARKRA